MSIVVGGNYGVLILAKDDQTVWTAYAAAMPLVWTQLPSFSGSGIITQVGVIDPNANSGTIAWPPYFFYAITSQNEAWYAEPDIPLWFKEVNLP
jgi:hypothetical protein